MAWTLAGQLGLSSRFPTTLLSRGRFFSRQDPRCDAHGVARDRGITRGAANFLLRQFERRIRRPALRAGPKRQGCLMPRWDNQHFTRVEFTTASRWGPYPSE